MGERNGLIALPSVTLSFIHWLLNNTKTEMFIFKNQIVFFDSRKQDNAHVFQKENDPV